MGNGQIGGHQLMFSRPMAQGAGAKTGTLAWGINVSNAKSIAFDIIKWIAERD